eukprot:3110986-Rhodomonas_salina.1
MAGTDIAYGVCTYEGDTGCSVLTFRMGLPGARKAGAKSIAFMMQIVLKRGCFALISACGAANDGRLVNDGPEPGFYAGADSGI